MIICHAVDVFKHSPKGYTPIVDALNKIKGNLSTEKETLLILATDGEPSTSTGHRDLDGFRNWMKQKPEGLHMVLVACSDKQRDVEYLFKFDRGYKNTDVVDDYDTMKKKMKKGLAYSFGDYVVTILLGSIDKNFKDFGEKKSLLSTIGDTISSSFDVLCRPNALGKLSSKSISEHK